MTKNNRRNTRKNNGRLTSSQVGTMISKALRRSVEPKFYDSVVSSTIGSGGTFFALSQPIIQGITGSQRIGDNIHLQRLQMNYRLDLNVANTQLSDTLRVVVVLDKMNDGVAPTGADLFTTATVTSPYSPEQIKSKRFTILYDKLDFVAIGGKNVLTVQKSIALNQVCTFQAATSVTAANGRNSMWVYCIGTSNTFPASFNMDFQVIFGDS